MDPLSLSNSSLPEKIAAVDLGSNSFHMIVGELRDGQLAYVERVRETVRLAEGLSPDGMLSADARSRALDCLARFGQRLRELRVDEVRTAGTSTIRRVREDARFMSAAEARLGHPIDVISGIEEARLIYAGVTHRLPSTEGPRLVVDIGGGSTEIILGEGAAPTALESLDIGCVALTERFFPNGEISASGFDGARKSARQKLQPVIELINDGTDFEAIGTSGTIRATEAIAQAMQISPCGISLDTVESIIDKIMDSGNLCELSLAGLSERRAQVLPGGLAILAEVLSALRIERMNVSDGALREGLLIGCLSGPEREGALGRAAVGTKEKGPEGPTSSRS